jgi:hypothetical protein
MTLVNSNSSNFVRVALLCSLGGALISSPAASEAASKTLTISGTPNFSVRAETWYSWRPTAKDTVPSQMRFAVHNKPAWASFDSGNGHLYGRPTPKDVGTYTNITISVSDLHGYVSLPAFLITVHVPKAAPAPVDAAPTISGRASTVVNVGTAYGFTPAAADANNDKLSFSIQNMPNWAKFDTASGSLSGTPEAANVGTYDNIRISVSDGKVSAMLPAFTITVNQMSAGNATLDWTPPTENSDGSVLTNLAGYNIHYGTSPDNLTQVVRLANPGLASYVVDNLSAGKWYFAVTSYVANGAESSNSGVVSTTIL